LDLDVVFLVSDVSNQSITVFHTVHL
jgi:hypothetical protein